MTQIPVDELTVETFNSLCFGLGGRAFRGMLGADLKSVPAAVVSAVPGGGVLPEDVGGQSKNSGEFLTLTP